MLTTALIGELLSLVRRVNRIILPIYESPVLGLDQLTPPLTRAEICNSRKVASRRGLERSSRLHARFLVIYETSSGGAACDGKIPRFKEAATARGFARSVGVPEVQGLTEGMQLKHVHRSDIVSRPMLDPCSIRARLTR